MSRNVANSGKTRMREQAEQVRGTCPSTGSVTGLPCPRGQSGRVGEKEGKEVDDAGKVYASRPAVGMCQLIFDESERCRQIETDSSPSSGFSLRGSRGVHARNTTHLNKTFCYLFTQNGCLFEMIIRTYLS